MQEIFSKWVACWGNATSISDRTEAIYSKNITLRYPVKMCFSGSKLRFRFSNLTGTEPVKITAATILLNGSFHQIKADEEETFEIAPGLEINSDPVDININAGDCIEISIYLSDFTQMNAGTLVTGPLSKGKYSYGNFAFEKDLPADLTRNTNWFYFLNTIDIFTEEKNHALICYGDSITAQSWPDYLTLRTQREGYNNVSIIRRAVCGTRILRQYDCITYAAYGLKGTIRFPVEMDVSGASAVIIQHGINDIIHPVGTEVNQFRPWDDMPTVDELVSGYTDIYIKHAKKLGLKVYAGTLLPIYGWRTYEDFRNDVRNDFNNWMRTTPLVDGIVDFDATVRDKNKPEAFAEGFDSGDHLHPSELAYEAMANCVPNELLK